MKQDALKDTRKEELMERMEEEPLEEQETPVVPIELQLPKE